MSVLEGAERISLGRPCKGRGSDRLWKHISASQLTAIVNLDIFRLGRWNFARA
jgi:hypothetical protein